MLEILREPIYEIVKDNDTFIFYNSMRHIACRVSELDLSIFNLIYIYKSLDIIKEHILPQYYSYIENVYDAVARSKILSEANCFDTHNIEFGVPKSYYLHLTYKCNLKCTYCYNKNIRNYTEELTFEQWKTILDKIVPVANNITITGGEPFLTPLLPEVINYINGSNKEIKVGIISNCMTHFEKYPFLERVFKHINNIVFSCDNLSGKDQPRVLFNSELFKRNIHFLRAEFPHLNIMISSVYTKCSKCEQNYIQNFAEEQNVNFRSVLVVPNSPKEAGLLPPLNEYKTSLKHETRQLKNLRTHCGAGVGILSIDPKGYVYPCQSLHYQSLRLGNLLYDSLDQLLHSPHLKAIRKDFCVDNIPECQHCKVKYICGGGCRAAVLHTENNITAFPHILCDYFKEKAVNELLSIPPMSTINEWRSCQ